MMAQGSALLLLLPLPFDRVDDLRRRVAVLAIYPNPVSIGLSLANPFRKVGEAARQHEVYATIPERPQSVDTRAGSDHCCLALATKATRLYMGAGGQSALKIRV
jgi:hypothetical protein